MQPKLQPDIYTVYVLHSEKHDKIYIGYTSNLVSRFHSHNSLSDKGWTKHYRPWKVVYCEYYESKREAMRREKALKGGQGRAFIKKMLQEKE